MNLQPLLGCLRWADFRVKKGRVTYGGGGRLIGKDVRRKEGECKGRRERKREQHFLHVEPCSQLDSQVSEKAFHTCLGICRGSQRVIPSSRGRDSSQWAKLQTFGRSTVKSCMAASDGDRDGKQFYSRVIDSFRCCSGIKSIFLCV